LSPLVDLSITHSYILQGMSQTISKEKQKRPIVDGGGGGGGAGDGGDDVRSSCNTWIDRALDHLRDHRMSPMVEVVVAWHVAVGCIVYYGYGYLRSCYHNTTMMVRSSKHTTPLLVPLTTEARRRRRRPTNTNQADRPDEDHGGGDSAGRWVDELCRLSAEELIAKVRGDLSLRRMVSRFMTTTTTTTTTTTIEKKAHPLPAEDTSGHAMVDGHDDDAAERLRSQLRAVWPRLLEFPPIIMDDESSAAVQRLEKEDMPISTTIASTSAAPSLSSPSFDISLIMPAFRETMERIVWTLEKAWRHCHDSPKRIQVIIVRVVDATGTQDNNDDGRNNDDDDENARLYNMLVQAGQIEAWGDVTVVQYRNNDNDDDVGGRGPAQNYGASLARGTLLTFLHADTVIPIHWDRKVRETLLLSSSSSSRRHQHDRNNIVVQACAFTFGHQTEQLDGMPYPWGIRAVWLLGNLRAYLFRLPYGDHIISIPTAYFRYLGGFPNQPIMEDYDLMNLLRQRAAVLPYEGIRIIPPPTARCSVRRWQRFGTVYVTLVNALLVHRYTQCGWTADDVYEYYYERPATTTTTTTFDVP
jgi:hypothetical protein